jgi:hypothetical protein
MFRYPGFIPQDIGQLDPGMTAATNKHSPANCSTWATLERQTFEEKVLTVSTNEILPKNSAPLPPFQKKGRSKKRGTPSGLGTVGGVSNRDQIPGACRKEDKDKYK